MPEPPTEYEKLTFEGRQISDAKELGVGYCGSGTLEGHVKQCRSDGSWVSEPALKRWADLARDARAVKASREAREMASDYRERARALMRQLDENGMKLEFSCTDQCLDLIERALRGPDDPIHRFAERIAPFVDHGLGTRLTSVFEEELAHALAQDRAQR